MDKRVFILNAIVGGTSICTIGVFDSMESLQIVRDRWEAVSEVELELFTNEMDMNVDNLLMDPEKYLTEQDRDNLKDVIRDMKIGRVLE